MLLGLVVPQGNTVTKPGAPGSVAVTFKDAAAASAGIPNLPATCTWSVLPAGSLTAGVTAVRVSTSRWGAIVWKSESIEKYPLTSAIR